VGRTTSAAQRASYGLERFRVFVVSTDILEKRQKMPEGTPVIDASRALYAIRDTLVQTLQTPLGKSDTDDWDVEHASFCHRIKCRKDHLVGEVARHTEKYEGI
jgi:hypothetical protein